MAVSALPPKSRVSGEGEQTNVLFVGEARVFWPTCAVGMIFVTNTAADLSSGPAGTLRLAAYEEGRCVKIHRCVPEGRRAYPVKVVP